MGKNWGDRIIEARTFNLFSLGTECYPSAYHAALTVAEKELSAAWAVVSARYDKAPPFDRVHFPFEVAGPLPPYNWDRWADSLGDLVRFYSSLDHIKVEAEISRIEAGLRQEIAALKRARWPGALSARPLMPEDSPGDLKAPAPEATDHFLDFTGKQRKLLATLGGKGKVPIDDVLKAVYGGPFGDKLDALLKLKDRTNKALSSKRPSLEIKREGETLSLKPV